MEMINLKKNKTISLSKGNKGLDYVRVGLGWDSKISIPITNKIKIPVPFEVDVDIDATVLVYSNNDKFLGECSFRNLDLYNKRSKLIHHHGDERVGGKKGDNEVIDIYLNEMSQTEAAKAYIVLNIFSPQIISFNWIRKAYIKLYDGSNKELASYDLYEDYGSKNGIIVAKLEKKNGAWNITPLGDGVKTSGINQLKQQAIQY